MEPLDVEPEFVAKDEPVDELRMNGLGVELRFPFDLDFPKPFDLDGLLEGICLLRGAPSGTEKQNAEVKPTSLQRSRSRQGPWKSAYCKL